MQVIHTTSERLGTSLATLEAQALLPLLAVLAAAALGLWLGTRRRRADRG